MRVARVFRKPPAAFLFPGWLLLVVGGTIAILVVFFILAVPFEDSAYIEDRALPKHAGEPVDPTIETYRVDVFASGSFLIESWAADRPYRIHIDRLAHWGSLRRLFEELREIGAEQVYLVVRDENDATTEVSFRLSAPWPELDANASAQEFLDALR